MGRMLDALKRADNTRDEVEGRATAPAPAVAATETETTSTAGEEIPYIEVGPHKSMEASASVLASLPAAPTSPRPEPRTIRVDEPRASLPAPRSVHFRALPGRAEARSRFAPELVAYHDPDQPAARQYGAVLDAMRNAPPSGERAAVLLFTSALTRCGTTTTLLNLAIAAARQERRVVVVDANLRQPAVAERLGLPAAPDCARRWPAPERWTKLCGRPNRRTCSR